MSEILLNSLYHIWSKQRPQHLSHLLYVLQDQVGVEPLEHHVRLVARVGQEVPGGDLGPLGADWTDTVGTVSADTGLIQQTAITSLLLLRLHPPFCSQLLELAN